MKKVAIITLYGDFNFGNKLQNYAVQEVIKSLDYSCSTIVCQNTAEAIGWKGKIIALLGIPKKIAAFKRFIYKNRYMFRMFSDKHLNFGVGIGTVYAHSMLVQVFANIGLIGFIITVMIHFDTCKFKLNLKNAFLLLMILIIYSGSSTLQEFTSLEILLVFIILNYCGSKDFERKYSDEKVLR